MKTIFIILVMVFSVSVYAENSFRNLEVTQVLHSKCEAANKLDCRFQSQELIKKWKKTLREQCEIVGGVIRSFENPEFSIFPPKLMKTPGSVSGNESSIRISGKAFCNVRSLNL